MSTIHVEFRSKALTRPAEFWMIYPEKLPVEIFGPNPHYQRPRKTLILLHGGGLYIAYILTYLINGWLQQQLIPILVFTGIFVAGYALVWLIIYCVEKAKAEQLNKLLKG